MNQDPTTNTVITPSEILIADARANVLGNIRLRLGTFAAGVGVVCLAACGTSEAPNNGASAEVSQSQLPDATPSATPLEPTETVASPESSKYPAHTVVATVFNLGEIPSAANAYISNTETAWDSSPVDRFGGVDNPEARTPEGLPVGFTPNHNPFYFALPADEFDENGLIDGARESSPWANEQIDEESSLFKGKWIKVTRGDKVIYAQWIDCGPSDNPDGARDYDYVFGPSDAKPDNQFGLKAGLDLSPTAAFRLGFGVAEGGAEVTWQFVDDDQVPDGLWTQYTAIDHATHWE